MREMDPSVDPSRGSGLLGAAGDSAATLISRIVAILERPALIGAADIAACVSALTTAPASRVVYDQALCLLTAIVYWRPDLVDDGVVAGPKALLTQDSLPEATHSRAGETLQHLLATPARHEAVAALLSGLARPGHARPASDILLDALEYTASWAPAELDLRTLIALAANPRLEQQRARLLRTVVEPVLFANLAAVSMSLLGRLMEAFGGLPDMKYVLTYLAGREDVPPPAGRHAQSAIDNQFALHDIVAARLGRGDVTVLVVQNIADGQGDEIIRVVPLLESLLSFNPLLDIVLITKRVYLYGHSRITLVPIDDEVSVEAVLRDRFDVVVDFYEANIREVNHANGLERQVRANVRAHPPMLHVTAQKGWNRFVYQRVDVQGRPYAADLGLDRQRVNNVYETTFRLIAELGLPLRLGEETPARDSVLAGLPCSDAESAWTDLLAQNAQGRLVALVCPFGGGEPLKGYVERQAHVLAARLRELIDEGFYVVLLPNGMPWGSARHARDVVSRLAPSERAHVVVAPDPADGSGQVMYRHAGTHVVPYASYQMRLISYFVRFADLIVSVEGWMIHAAFCLGKRFRILMLPYSHQSEWHPYGRTQRQALVISGPPPTLSDASSPPLPEQPRKFVLISLLGWLGAAGDERAVPLLLLVLRSEDSGLRLAAASALAGFPGPTIDAALRNLLADPAYRVRAAAAEALLARRREAPGAENDLPRELLEAHRRIGLEPRSWADVLRLGDPARPAVETALGDDDPVLRREAELVLRSLNQRVSLISTDRPAPPSGGRKALARVLQIGADRSARGIRLLRGAGRRTPVTRPLTDTHPSVLILTPVKDAADCLDGYVRGLRRLTYPRHLISVGFLESDSSDTTLRDLQRHTRALRSELRRVGVWKKDFGYLIPPGVPRWAPEIQVERRGVLAKSRNHLLFRALDDEAWVLWLDVDVIDYPPDLIERLLGTRKDIVQPHCVLDYGGPSFDLNAWRDHGRLHLDDLRGEGELVELDAVGGTVLLVRADLHREGLVFPSFLYGLPNPRIRTGRRDCVVGEVAGEIETEGLGMMARDMGYRCWGMPGFEVRHRRK